MKLGLRLITTASLIVLSTACGPERRLHFRVQDQAADVQALLNGASSMSSASAVDASSASPDVARAKLLAQGDYFEDPALSRVTTDFGQLEISVPTAIYRSPVAEASVKPWSSWWYPKFEDTLFRAEKGLSVLDKYDLYRDALFKVRRPEGIGAAAFEKRKFNPASLSWEGLCDAWSMASILAPEPKQSRTVRVGSATHTFSVGDQKALILKTYEGILDSETRIYGQKFTGSFDGWIQPDVFPDQFHRFVEAQLFERKQAFVMDHDAGIEIWNVPVFRANYSLSPVPGRDDAVQVRMWLYSASSTKKDEMDFVGTKETIREYHYILFGKMQATGKLAVHSGVWIKGPNGIDSRKDHPDYFVTVPEPEKITRKSFNPSINPEAVDAIIEGKNL